MGKSYRNDDESDEKENRFRGRQSARKAKQREQESSFKKDKDEED